MEHKPLLVRSAAITATAMLLSACWNTEDRPRAGADRSVAHSPDQRFKAIVRETNIDGSVMVSQPFEVILETAIPARAQVVVLSSDRTEGLKISWKGPTLLEVCYGKGTRIYKFKRSLS